MSMLPVSNTPEDHPSSSSSSGILSLMSTNSSGLVSGTTKHSPPITGSCNSSLMCHVCLHPPHHPVYPHCQHVICRDCCNVALRLGARCPVCNEEIRADNLVVGPAARADKFVVGPNPPVSTSLAELEKELERLKRKKAQLLSSKEREIKKMALEFLSECRDQKLMKLKKLKSELVVVQDDINALMAGELGGPEKSELEMRIQTDDQVSSNYANILKNLPDLENYYFSPGSSSSTTPKHGSIGELIYRAFWYGSLRDVGEIEVADSRASKVYVYGMSGSSTTGLLSVTGTLDTVNIYRPEVDTQLPVVYPVTKLPVGCHTWSSCWNPASPALLAIGDYKSQVRVWDVHVHVATHTFLGHVSSKYLNVVWCPGRPQQLVSAGFDSPTVRVWRLGEQSSVLNVKLPDKPLMIKCKPGSPFHLAVSSVDRNLYSFDLRRPDKPINVFSGHSKSAFQLCFQDNKTLYSAAVDGTLKQWQYDKGQCVRTYRGHVNAVKFIGLEAIGEEHVVCGSEDNSLVLYHQALSKPVLIRNLGSAGQEDIGDDEEHSAGGGRGDKEGHISAVVKVGEVLCSAHEKGKVRLLALEEDRKITGKWQ